MKVYTFSEARQNFATVLDHAQKDGAVRITRRDGRVFTVQPERSPVSPLAVKSVSLGLTRSDIVAAVRESRERGVDAEAPAETAAAAARRRGRRRTAT